MYRLSLLLCSVLIAAPSTFAVDQTAAKMLPETTILYAELPNPSALIATIFDHPLRQKIEALEPYKMATKTDGYRGFMAGKKFVEIQLGMDWREALEALTAHGVYIGVDGPTQGLALLVHAKDADTLDLFRTKMLGMAQLGQNADKIEEGEYRGVTAYEINKTKFAIVDDWLLMTNKGDTGKAVLDLLIDKTGKSLVDNETYQEARATRKDDTTAWAFVDLKTIRDAGAAKNLFKGQADNPAIELMIGGILSTLQHTPYVTASFGASNSGLGLELSVPHKSDWVPESREFYFGPDGTGQGPKLPQIKDTLFTLSSYRDVAEMWLRAGDLFNEQINDGFAEADANLTTFFSGKDFGEDILGSLTPKIGLVASKQSFKDVLPIPAIKLPQFALVLEMKEPDTMTRELRRTFQSMVGFFNVLGAMNGQPQLEMDMDKLDDGAQLVTSTYIPEPEDANSTRADIIFNFSPSVGFAKERFVVASTDRLARELIQANVARDANPSGPANTHASLKADVLKSVLNDNREQLISQNMLEDGNSRDEAEAAIGLLLEFVGYFEDASIKLDTGLQKLALRFDLRVKAD